MAMHPCTKCLNNSWDFETVDGIVTATCKHCANEVQFESKNSGAQKMKTGDDCRKCGIKIIYKELQFKQKKLNKAYYYTGCYRCNGCKTNYFSDEFKVIN